MTTDNPWLHRYAIFVAFCALVAIAAGAVVTSLLRPIAGPLAAGPPEVIQAAQFWHHIAGGVAVVLMLGLAIGVSAQFGWIGLAAAMIDAALGAAGQVFPQLSGILHALLAQIFF